MVILLPSVMATLVVCIKRCCKDFLHAGHLLLLRRDNKRWHARSSLARSKVRLKLLEVFVGRFGDKPQILSEGLRVLRGKTFCALQHLEFPYRIYKDSSKLWCVPA